MMEKRKLRQIEAESSQKQLEGVEIELKELETTRNEHRDKLRTLEAEVSKSRELQHSAHQEVMTLMQTEGEIESELKQDTLRLEHNQDRKEQLLERNGRMKEQIDEYTESLDAKKEVVDKYNECVDEKKAGSQASEKEIQNLNAQIETVKKELDVVVREIAESKARQKVLLRIREQMEGFSTGSKKILKETTRQESTLFNKVKGLYESITPTKGTEKALSVVLRRYTQTLVVENKEDLDAVIAYAKENNLKDYSIICLDQLTERQNALSDASSLLSKVGENNISKHFLNDVYLVEKPQDAFQLIKNATGVEVWTADGAYIDQRGVIFYSSEGENNVFIREAEIKNLDQKVKEKEAEQLALEKTLELVQEKKSSLQEKKTELEKSLRQDEIKLVEANFVLQRLRTDLEKMKTEKVRVEEELSSLGTVSEALREEIAILKQKHTEAKAKAEEVKQRDATLSAELTQQTETLQMQQGGLQEIEPNYQKSCR